MVIKPTLTGLVLLLSNTSILAATVERNGCPDDRPVALNSCDLEQTFMKPETCCIKVPLTIDYGTQGGASGENIHSVRPSLEQGIMNLRLDAGSKVEVTR